MKILILLTLLISIAFSWMTPEERIAYKKKHKIKFIKGTTCGVSDDEFRRQYDTLAKEMIKSYNNRKYYGIVTGIVLLDGKVTGFMFKGDNDSGTGTYFLEGDSTWYVGADLIKDKEKGWIVLKSK